MALTRNWRSTPAAPGGSGPQGDARFAGLVCLLPVVCLALPLSAAADVERVWGATKFSTSLPPSLEEGQFEDDYFAWVFREWSLLDLPSSITLNAKEYGGYWAAAPPLVSEPLNPPELIRSDYLHFDPDIKWFGSRRVSGFVQFKHDILGVIATKSDLAASHPIVGATFSTDYPLPADDEGIEVINQRNADFFFITPMKVQVGNQVQVRKRGLYFTFGAVDDVDTLRIITQGKLPGD